MRYSIDPATGESYWLASGDDEEEPETKEEQECIPEGVWERYLDEASGDYYECHSITNEVRWMDSDDDEGGVRQDEI